MTALQRIAAALDALAAQADEPDHRIDSFDLRVLARQVRAQDEMADKGLSDA